MTTKITIVDGLSNLEAAQIYRYLNKIIHTDKDWEFSFVTSKNNTPWPFKHKPSNLIRLWDDNNYVRKLYSFFKKNNPTIIHFFFEIRMFGKISASFRFPLLIILLRLQKIKMILTIYNTLVVKTKNGWELMPYITTIKLPKFLIKLLGKLFIKTTCRFCDTIIVENDLIKECLVDYYGIKQKKILILKNAIDLELEPINQNKKSDLLQKFGSKKIILCFGVFSPRKGQIIGLQAFNKIKKEIPDCLLVFAGYKVPEFKQYEDEIHKFIIENNLTEKVLDLGPVDNDTINILYNLSKLAIYPYFPVTSGSGAFSFSLRHKVPSVVTNTQTFNHILNGKGALFVEPGNIDEFAKMMLKILKDEKFQKNLILEMTEIANSRRCETITNEHFKIYKNLINNY
jgi:glycosyltransferase involved in cell wall biosynthesis